jgi:GTP-binding protein
MVPGDTDDIVREYQILLNELRNFNPDMLDKHRVLAVTKCDLLDDELIEMLSQQLHRDIEQAKMDDIPVVFISSVANKNLDKLKDVLWKELNSESNKLQSITADDRLVHRDKDMSSFAMELEAEGEDEIIFVDDEDIEDLDDYELVDVDE